MDRDGLNAGVLRAADLTLRRWQRSDRPEWLALFSDPEVLRWVGDGSVDPERDAAVFERLMSAAIGPEERFAFMYAAESSGELVGHVELKRTEHTREGEWELVYLLARSAWGAGRGAALAAFGARMAHAHGRRVIATVARENAASLHILGKLGLEIVGELHAGETLLLREPRVGVGAS